MRFTAEKTVLNTLLGRWKIWFGDEFCGTVVLSFLLPFRTMTTTSRHLSIFVHNIGDGDKLHHTSCEKNCSMHTYCYMHNNETFPEKNTCAIEPRAPFSHICCFDWCKLDFEITFLMAFTYDFNVESVDFILGCFLFPFFRVVSLQLLVFFVRFPAQKWHQYGRQGPWSHPL